VTLKRPQNKVKTENMSVCIILCYFALNFKVRETMKDGGFSGVHELSPKMRVGLPKGVLIDL